jgi:AAA family ATP:ADP antiporter
MGLLWESALAMLVISYGICIYVGEVSWKLKLKVAFPDPNAYSVFMGNFSLAMRSVTLITMLLGSKIFQKFGFGEKVCLTSALALPKQKKA